MKYKIEIWQYHNITETYESDDIEEILKWYIENWYYTWDYGNCAFEIYEDGKRLTFDETLALGFFDYEYE